MDIRHFKKQMGKSNYFSRPLKAEEAKIEYAQAVFLFDGEIPPEMETRAPQEQNTLEGYECSRKTNYEKSTHPEKFFGMG